MSIVKFRARVTGLELKVRHVRTQAGVEKYKLPIGSPIVARAKKIKARIVGPRPIERAMDQSAQQPKTPKYDKDGIYWRKATDWEREQLGDILVGHLKDGRQARVKDRPREAPARRYMAFVRNGEGLADPLSIAYHPTEAAAKKYLQEYIREQEAKKPKRVKKKYKNFYDHYEGVYGWDWTWGDPKYDNQKLIDRSQSDDEKVSRPARRELAMQESEDLGISVLPQKDHKVDTAAWETINAIARAYETMYPGFNDYTPVYKLDALNLITGSVAYNSPQYRVKRAQKWDVAKGGPSGGYDVHVMDIPSADGLTRDWDHNEIGLSPSAFEEGFDESNLDYRVRSSNGKGWWSNNLQDVAEAKEMELWQVYQHHTINHELGHSVARILMGEMSTKEADSSDYNRDVRSELTDILRKHKAILYDQEGDLPVDYPSKESVMLSLKKDVIKANVSEYGATNLHELMAESWAAYQMNDAPTEMQLEIGQLMEWYLINWIEKNKGVE